MPARNRTTASYGAAHQRRARQLKADMRDGDPCCRCGGPMWRWQLQLQRNDIRGIDADHYQCARALGGELPDALAHRRCNRRAGARLGQRLRAGTAAPAAPRPLPQW